MCSFLGHAPSDLGQSVYFQWSISYYICKWGWYLIWRADSIRYWKVPRTCRLSADSPLHIIVILTVCWVAWGLDERDQCLEESLWDSSSKRKQGLSGSKTEWINSGPSSWCLVMSSNIPSPRSELQITELGGGWIQGWDLVFGPILVTEGWGIGCSHGLHCWQLHKGKAEGSSPERSWWRWEADAMVEWKEAVTEEEASAGHSTGK